MSGQPIIIVVNEKLRVPMGLSATLTFFVIRRFAQIITSYNLLAIDSNSWKYVFLLIDNNFLYGAMLVPYGLSHTQRQQILQVISNQCAFDVSVISGKPKVNPEISLW